MPHTSDQRLRDVDEQLRPLHLASAVVAAAAGVTFASLFGPSLVVPALLPGAYWLVRSGPLGRRGSAWMWVRLLLVTLAASLVGAGLASGMSSSPVLALAGVLGVVAHVYVPDLRLSVAVASVPFVVLVGIDLLTGGTVSIPLVATEALLALYLPAFTHRMVTIEQAQRRRATLDQLTGCLNRHALESRARELEEQGQRAGGHVGAIVIDLDHFKQLNDEHGHAFGDRVLVETADVVRGCLRRYELVYRLGGEEFAVLLPGADIATTLRIAEKIRVAIDAEEVDGVSVTASVGASSAAAPFDVAAVLEDADHSLYEAKAAGRNRVVAAPFDPRRLVRASRS